MTKEEATKPSRLSSGSARATRLPRPAAGMEPFTWQAVKPGR